MRKSRKVRRKKSSTSKSYRKARRGRRRNPVAHQDFIGNTLKVGDYIACPGSGNGRAEYGALLHKVLELKENGSVQTERITVKYPDHKTPSFSRSKTTISSLTKVVLVKPSAIVKKVFENPEQYPDTASKWIHGTKLIDWADPK